MMCETPAEMVGEFEDNRHSVSLDRLNRAAQGKEIAALDVHLHEANRGLDI